jgi:hypothetical protein
MEIRIYRTIILCVVWYWCGMWSFTLREEHMLRVVKNWVPRKMLGSNRAKVMGNRKNSITGSFIIFTLFHILRSMRMKMGGACGTCGRQEMHSPGFWWQNLKKIIAWKT